MLECVVNISEGRDQTVLSALVESCTTALLDIHIDQHHNRSVFTLAGCDVEAAVRNLSALAAHLIDLRSHAGVHPRFGVIDVVPFVPLSQSQSQSTDASGTLLTADRADSLRPAVAARNRYADWAAETLGIPCFFYGPERILPDVRRLAFKGLEPDTGPATPHLTAGSSAVGARTELVAYNLWLDSSDISLAQSIAKAIRSPSVRSLGLDVDGHAQVSCNLINPLHIGPADAYDMVSTVAAASGTTITRAELVGLISEASLSSIPRQRWPDLDLGPDRTIEARLMSLGSG